MDEAGVAVPNETPTTPARFTVTLVPDGVMALANLQKRTGVKKVDVINRAVVVYELFDRAVRDQKTIILRDKYGNEEIVRIV